MILPKAAETHLPTLESKEGILISMDDLDGLHVWSFKYRYWINNNDPPNLNYPFEFIVVNYYCSISVEQPYDHKDRSDGDVPRRFITIIHSIMIHKCCLLSQQ
ncbi:uncharacterized protein [Euphorbia lathyris]|uniref:uncharacterized protein isoform X2 n=1 Tax=Euphorbia lathyris TaxID=212925 RepID=UPI003313E07A